MYDLCCFTFLNSLSAYMANKYVYIPSNWQELGSSELKLVLVKKALPSISVSYSSWNSVKKIDGILHFYH